MMHPWMAPHGHVPMQPAQHGMDPQPQMQGKFKSVVGILQYTSAKTLSNIISLCPIVSYTPLVQHSYITYCLVFPFIPELLKTPGGSHMRGSRGHSPSFQPQSSDTHWTPPTEIKTNTPVAPPTSTSLAPPTPAKPDTAAQSDSSQVESWEDIDDTPPSQPPQQSTALPHSLSSSTATAESTELKVDSVSNSSSGRSTPKSQELPLVKEAPSTSASSSSTPDLAKVERKQPSPILPEKGGAGRAEGGGVAKGSKHGQAPPPKDEDEKENINIVFIGHVGES